MTWPQAFAIVGFMAPVAAIVWAVAWMAVRTKPEDLSFGDPPTRMVKTRDAPRPPRES